MVREVNVGLVGLGNIGSGVVEILKSQGALIEKRTGVRLTLVAVCDKFSERAKSLGLEKIYCSDYKQLLKNKKVNVVVELIGGYEPARTIIVDALKAKKNVVTANKAVLAKHGYELFSLAQKNKVNILFEASVGGCIPVIRTVEESFSSDTLSSIYGILNGTTNFILTRMNEGMEYSGALKRAQELGFAESDPSFDVLGKDAAQKLFLLASLAFDAKFTEEFSSQGITSLTKKDIEYARDLGYSIKLLAVAKKSNGAVEARISPVLVPLSHIFSSVNNEVNAILLYGKQTGQIFLSGKGAGKFPTATVVVTDLIEVGSRTRVAQRFFQKTSLLPAVESVSKFFIRLSVSDRAGVLASIAKILKEENVSLSAVEQKESDGMVASIVLVTHKTKQGSIDSAVKKFGKLPEIKSLPLVMRIESFE
jgi:homoserine dehydrogenase